MISYKVYLTDKKNKDENHEFKSKEKVIECVNDANIKDYYGFKIIMNMEGTDIFIKRGIFSNTNETIEIPELDDEWQIKDGKIINYTKYLKYLKKTEPLKGEER